MTLKRFKWWHGLLLGPLIGTALWYAHASLTDWTPPRVIAGLSPQQFTRLVTASAATGPNAHPALTDLTLHPPSDGRQFITGRATQLRWNGPAIAEPFEFTATLPFTLPTPPPARPTSGLDSFLRALSGNRPANNAPSATPAPAPPPPPTYPTLRDYLAKAAPSLPYRYEWWREPRTAAALWIGTPTLALALLLPTLLMLLTRAGLLAPPPDEAVEISLTPPPSSPAPAQSPSIDPATLAAIEAQLQAATTSLEQNLGLPETPTDAPTPPSPASPSPTPFTSAPPDDTPLTPQPTPDPTSYDRGEFYPVSRGPKPTRP